MIFVRRMKMAQRQSPRIGFQNPNSFIYALLNSLQLVYPEMESISRVLAKDPFPGSNVYRRDTRRIQELLIAGKRLSRPRWV